MDKKSVSGKSPGSAHLMLWIYISLSTARILFGWLPVRVLQLVSCVVLAFFAGSLFFEERFQNGLQMAA
ncbi:hypothetical protein AB2N08_07990 [Massilia aurea]